MDRVMIKEMIIMKSVECFQNYCDNDVISINNIFTI